MNETDSDIYRIHPTPDPNSPTGVFIPSNIEEAIAELEKALHPQLIEEIRGMDKSQLIGLFHFGLGMWIRNNWGLWKSSQLAKFLLSQGCFHPDDMSSSILEQFWQHLQNIPD